MQERDLVNQIAEIAARLKRIERWQDQWRTRDRQVANLNADKVTASEGYLVAFGRGLCANRHVEHRPAFSNYSVGETVILPVEPRPEYNSLLPVWWVVPAKVGDVESLVRFTFTDYTTIDQQNLATTDLEERHPANLLFFKDGVACSKVEFVVDNKSGAPQSQTVGTFKFQGWQF